MDLSKPNPSYKSSVKGMKVLARLRASQSLMVSAVGEAFSACPQSTILSHEHELHDASVSHSNYGGHQKAYTTQFQFTTGQHAVVGQVLRGSGSCDSGDGKPEFITGQQAVVGQVLRGSGNRDSEDGKSDPCCVLGQRRASDTMELELPSDKQMESLEKQVHCVANLGASIDGCAQSTRGFTGDGVGVFSAQYVHVAGQGTEEGYAEAEQMEFEGEGKAAATC